MSQIELLLDIAREELETAELLLANERLRACISRSYYAMYHATQALLSSKGIRSKTHKGAIQAFGQHFIKSEELPVDLARSLSSAYDLRRLSDYEVTVLLTREQAARIVTAAKAFIEQAQNYLSS